MYNRNKKFTQLQDDKVLDYYEQDYNDHIYIYTQFI